MSLQYRPEIDGLRTVAVVPVILFHSGLALPGGFVGVDVFFVISGFLIGSLLMAERVNTGRISIIGFYERRARRIIPALVFVTIACLPVAWSLMLPSELELFGRSMASTMLFLSNVLFWKSSGYFSPATELMPLLHTWSLAVEEQYYIVFPIFLIVAWRLGKSWVAGAMVAFTLASFALGEWASHTFPTAAFYLLPTRAWELLVGALLALWTFKRPYPQGVQAELASGFGLMAIFGAIFLFDEYTPWPGSMALVPVLGTAAIIWGGGSTYVGRFLALKPMVGVGLISYAAYLWHQPLFAFARLYRGNEPSYVEMTSLSILTLALAWATWRFVEKPFRNRTNISSDWILRGSGISLVAISLLGVALVLKQGVPERFPDWQRAWLVPPSGGYGATVETPYQNDLLPMGAESPSGALLLVGDSYSQDFYNILRATDLLNGRTLHRHFIHNRCQPILVERRSPKIIEEQQKPICADAAVTDEEIQQMARYDAVLLVANWKDWSIEESILVAQAIERENGKVIAVGKKRFSVGGFRNFVGLSLEEVKSMRMPVSNEIEYMDQRLREEFGEDQFLSIMETICDGSGDDACRVATRSGTPISYDGGHLTPQGVEYLAPLLAPKLRLLFEDRT